MNLRFALVLLIMVCSSLWGRADSFRPQECRPIALEVLNEGPAPEPVPLPAGLAWYWFANHTHTEYSSDSSCPLERRIRGAAALGADAISITDHGNNDACSDPMFQTLDGCVPMCGEEWGSDFEGDVGLLNFTGPSIGGGTLDQMIAIAESRGATIIANHPFVGSEPWLHEDLHFGIDGVEVWTSFLYLFTGYQAAIDWWHGFAVNGRRVFGIAGSDDHYDSLTTLMPCNYTLAASPQPDDIQDAVEAGHMTLCSDANIERCLLWCDANGDGAYELTMGDNLAITSAADIRFRIEAYAAQGDTLQVFTKQGIVQTLTVGEGDPWRIDFTASVDRKTKDFVRAEIRREENVQNPLASLTNPIYINYTSDDADSDGLPDVDEAEVGTDHYNADTDGDGVRDGFEAGYDGDIETYNPYDPDTNPTGGDLNALSEDTDGDGFTDSEELTYETDPLDSSSVPELPSVGNWGALILAGIMALIACQGRLEPARNIVR